MKVAFRLRCSARVARPVRGAQHLQDGRCHGRALASGDAVQIDGATKFDATDRSVLQCLGTRHATRREGNAPIRFEQGDQISFGRKLVPVTRIEIMAANERIDLFRLLAIAASQPALLSEVVDLNCRTRSQAVLGVEDSGQTLR